jgi:hypothetical protein
MEILLKSGRLFTNILLIRRQMRDGIGHLINASWPMTRRGEGTGLIFLEFCLTWMILN